MSKNENNGCALEINNLNKQYKTSEFELKKVTFSVPTGTVVGLIGENGSGKTTTLSSLLGLTNYESGTIKYMGTKIKADDVKIKEDRFLCDVCIRVVYGSRHTRTIRRGTIIVRRCKAEQYHPIAF